MSRVDNWSNSVACIGETTASAAKKLGLESVYYPATPGLEGYEHKHTRAHIIIPFSEQRYHIVMDKSLFVGHSEPYIQKNTL